MRSKSYQHRHKKYLEISWERYGQVVKNLAKKVKDKYNPDCIVGNSKGGCIIGGTLAAILRLDFYPKNIQELRR